MTYTENTNRKNKTGTARNTVGALMFIFVVCALSAMVGVSLYHCLAQQHIMGLVGETEKHTGTLLTHLAILIVAISKFHSLNLTLK